jgi:hypothetical protein
MRSTSVKVSVATTVLAIVLTAVPAEARQRRNEPSARDWNAARVVQMIRAAMGRTFGTIAQALPTIPIPGTPTASPSETELLSTDSAEPTNERKK